MKDSKHTYTHIRRWGALSQVTVSFEVSDKVSASADPPHRNSAHLHRLRLRRSQTLNRMECNGMASFGEDHLDDQG